MKYIIIFILIIILFGVFIYKRKQYENYENYPIRVSSNYLETKAKVYKDILTRVSRVFHKLNIPFFLSSGTCLGFYREGKFLDHDYDIDVGVMRNVYTHQMLQLL